MDARTQQNRFMSMPVPSISPAQPFQKNGIGLVGKIIAKVLPVPKTTTMPIKTRTQTLKLWVAKTLSKNASRDSWTNISDAM